VTSIQAYQSRTPLNAIIGLTEMMVTNAARFGMTGEQQGRRRTAAHGSAAGGDAQG
jgi:hypothetical protein